MMELRHLRHFVAVVECGTLSRAAELVCLSQPALTRSIRSLEELLGADLLERRPRGMVPTPAGAALYDHARLMLNEAERAQGEVAAVAAGGRGALAIGIAAMFADHIVDRAVAAICAGGDDIALTVTQGFLEELVAALRDGRLDMIFSNLSNISLGDDLLVEPVLDLHAYAYAGADHPLAGAQPISKAMLLQQRWAVVDQPHMRDFLDHYFSADGLPAPAFVVRTNSLNLIRSLIAGGGFVGVLPDHLVAAQVAAGSVVRLPAPDCPIVRRAGIITRRGLPPRPMVARFMAQLRLASKNHA